MLMLKNICTTNHKIHIYCNASKVVMKTIGNLPRFCTVWYHEGVISNIISLAKIKNQLQVTYDSQTENIFVVHHCDSTTREFKESKTGLYYSGMSLTVMALVINTVANNKSKCSCRNIVKAKKAQNFQETIGNPSLWTLLTIVNKNILQDCPVTCSNICGAENIFGPTVALLKGKTVRWNLPTVEGIFPLVEVFLLLSQ